MCHTSERHSRLLRQALDRQRNYDAIGVAGAPAYTAEVNIPPGMQLAFQGKASFIREVLQQLKGAGIETITGPMPGG
ncbi:MAG: hypothetical protein ACI8UD_000915 [Planctomycetota bacterium]